MSQPDIAGGGRVCVERRDEAGGACRQPFWELNGSVGNVSMILILATRVRIPLAPTPLGGMRFSFKLSRPIEVA